MKKQETKQFLINMPIHLYLWLERLQPLITTTMNGTIIECLGHGINYEIKQHKEELKQKKAAASEEATVDQDQNNNSEESRIRQALKKMGYTDEQLNKMDDETQRSLLYKILKTEIK